MGGDGWASEPLSSWPPTATRTCIFRTSEPVEPIAAHATSTLSLRDRNSATARGIAGPLHDSCEQPTPVTSESPMKSTWRRIAPLALPPAAACAVPPATRAHISSSAPVVGTRPSVTPLAATASFSLAALATLEAAAAAAAALAGTRRSSGSSVDALRVRLDQETTPPKGPRAEGSG
eukprot:scaffold5429_cov32-Tisochrysis_lutea.AAC.1